MILLMKMKIIMIKWLMKINDNNEIMKMIIINNNDNDNINNNMCNEMMK